MVKAISLYRRGELRQAIKRTDPTLLENFIQFLENDPIEFGSGYKKEIVWRYIRRYPLNGEQIHRLEQAAFRCLARPMAREFKFMYQTMSHIATEAFWKRIEGVLQVVNPIMQINAYCLYAYSKGIYAGEKQRLELKKVKRDLRWMYLKSNQHYKVDDLLSLLREPENWPNGEVIYREPKREDLPILEYQPARDQEFASLNVSMGNKDFVLRQLNVVLSMGILTHITSDTWTYAIYLLEQLNDPKVVGLLIDFMNQKLDFAINYHDKKMVAQMVLRVLNYYGTPEALEAIRKLETITKHHCNIGMLG